MNPDEKIPLDNLDPLNAYRLLMDGIERVLTAAANFDRLSVNDLASLPDLPPMHFWFSLGAAVGNLERVRDAARGKFDR